VLFGPAKLGIHGSSILKRPRQVVALAGLWLLAAALLLGGCANGASSRSEDFRTVIRRAQERVFPALVFIKPIKQQLGSGERTRRRVFGSGVILSPDGLIVTNSHVAKDSAEIKCVLYDRRQFPARVVGFDTDTDLALLKLQLPKNHAPLPTVAMGDSDRLHEGEFVMALGSPLGFTRSISFGVVSCTRRYLEVGPYSLWIQTDAAINPGNSGGPLVNDRGEVIGINTMRAAVGENIGFAIPARTVTRVIDELHARGKIVRAYTGIQLRPVKDFVRDVILDYDKGVLVGGVDERSPAAGAGLKAGDVILQCNRDAVNGIYLEDLPDVRVTFASLPPDQPAELRLMRGEEVLSVTVTPVLKQRVDQEGLELKMWNCSAQEISKFWTPVLAYVVPRGVYVLGVRQPGNAHASGLRSRDILLTIDREPVTTLEGLREIYRQLSRLDEGKRTALVEVMRSGYRKFVVLDFNRDYKSPY